VRTPASALGLRPHRRPSTPLTLDYSTCFNGVTIAPEVSGGTIAGGTVPLVLGSGCE
jgi:hypothetical protein